MRWSPLGVENIWVKHIYISVVNIRFRMHKVKQFTSLITYQVQLETEIPSHNTLTSFCIPTEHLVPCYVLVVAYGNTCAVNETYTRASAKAKQLKEQHHLNRDFGLEFNKAVI